MKIEKLIKAFEKALPYYQQAVDENWGFKKLARNFMENGFCKFYILKFDIDLCSIFENKGYYRNFTSDGYLYYTSLFVNYGLEIEQCIKPRLEFLKTEIKDLKRLQKLGYTDV